MFRERVSGLSRMHAHTDAEKSWSSSKLPALSVLFVNTVRIPDTNGVTRRTKNKYKYSFIVCRDFSSVAFPLPIFDRAIFSRIATSFIGDLRSLGEGEIWKNFHTPMSHGFSSRRYACVYFPQYRKRRRCYVGSSTLFDANVTLS